MGPKGPAWVVLFVDLFWISFQTTFRPGGGRLSLSER